VAQSIVADLAQPVDHAHHGHEDLARGKRPDDAHADLPVEAERRQRGLQRLAETPAKAVLERRAPRRLRAAAVPRQRRGGLGELAAATAVLRRWAARAGLGS
jgi:hypothetical protein